MQYVKRLYNNTEVRLLWLWGETHLLWPSCVAQRPRVADWRLSWSAWGPRTPKLHSTNNRWDSPAWSSRTMTRTPSDRAWPHLRCRGITCTPTVNTSTGNQNLLFIDSILSIFWHCTTIFFFLSRFQGSVPWDRPSVSFDWQWLSASGGLLPSHPDWPPLLHAGLLLHLLRMRAGVGRVLFTLHLSIRFPSFSAPVQEIRARKVWAHCDNMQ